MSSAGRAANSNGCASKPKEHATGLIGFAAQIRRSLLIGSCAMETAEHREPCESRGSRTDLGAPGGEIPPGDSTSLCKNASPVLIPAIGFSCDLREDRMRRFVEGVDRGQTTLFPECLEDWIGEDNPVRVVDVFVEELDLAELGFGGVDPEATGRPSYHPSILLKLYIYGYLNRVQSSRRLEYEAGRNVEVMWLLGRLVPDHKTIADFRKDNGAAIRKVCAHFIALCRAMGLLTQASVANRLKEKIETLKQQMR